MTIASLTLFPPDRSAPALSAVATRALLGAVTYGRTHGEPARLRTTALQFAPDAAALVRRATLRAVYDTGTVRWWRVSAVDETTGGGDRLVTCEWRPLWVDAGETVARDRAAVGGDLTLALTGVSPADALAALCDPANGAPTGPGGALLVPGTVAAGLPSSVDLVLDGPSTLGALETLAGLLPVGDQQTAEAVLRVVPGAAAEDDVYAVDLVDPSASPAATATVEITADRSTVQSLRRSESDTDALSVLIPVAPGEAPAGTLAGNRWAVASADGAEVTLSRRSYEIPGAAPAYVVWETGALVGHRVTLYSPDGSTIEREVVASAVSNVLTLDGPVGDAIAVRLLDPDGAPLVALESPALVAALDRKEARIEFPDVHPRAELLSQTGRLAFGTEGVSTDMSAWVTDGSRPYGVYPFAPIPGVGDETPVALTRETDPAYVQYGTASLRAVGSDSGDGYQVTTGPYRGDLGVWASLQVLSGRVLVRILANDGAGNVFGLKDVTVSAGAGTDGDAVSAWREVAVAITEDYFPAEFGALPINLQFYALGGPAEWVLDAVAVVGVPQAVPYSPSMGPEALHEAAARELARRVATGTDTYDVEALDLAEIGAGLPGETPLAVGDTVALRLTRRDVSTVEEITARVVEVEYVEGVGAPPVAKRIRLGRALPAFGPYLRRLTGSASGTATGSSSAAATGGTAGGSGDAPSAPLIEGVAQSADLLLVSLTPPPPGVAVMLEIVGPDGEVAEAATLTPNRFAAVAEGEPLVVPLRVRAVGSHTVRAVATSGGGYSDATETAVEVLDGAPGSGPYALPAVTEHPPSVGSQGLTISADVPDDGRIEALRVEVTMTDATAGTRVLPIRAAVLPGSRYVQPFRPPLAFRVATVSWLVEPAPSNTAAYVAATEAVLIPDAGTGAYLTDETGSPFVFTPAT